MAITKLLGFCLLLTTFGPDFAYAFALKAVAHVSLPCETTRQTISPTGEQIALQCTDQSVRLLNLRSGSVDYTFTTEPRIECYTYSHDGRWFALGRWDGTVEVIATTASAEPRQWHTEPRIDALEFSPDSRTLIVGPIGSAGEVWSLNGNPRKLGTLYSDFSGLTACAFSSDGKLLVTADGDTAIRFYDTASWQKTREYRGLKLETFAIAFTPDGQRVQLGGAEDRIVELDLSGVEQRRLVKEAGVVMYMAPIGDSGRAVLLYFDSDGKAPPHPSLWDMRKGESSPLLSEPQLSGGGIVHGKLWVTSNKDKTVEVWEYEQ